MQTARVNFNQFGSHHPQWITLWQGKSTASDSDVMLTAKPAHHEWKIIIFMVCLKFVRATAYLTRQRRQVISAHLYAKPSPSIKLKLFFWSEWAILSPCAHVVVMAFTAVAIKRPSIVGAVGAGWHIKFYNVLRGTSTLTIVVPLIFWASTFPVALRELVGIACKLLKVRQHVTHKVRVSSS